MASKETSRSISMIEGTATLAVSALQGHTILKSSHLLSDLGGSRKYDIDPDGNVTYYSGTNPYSFTSDVLSGLRLQGITRREHSIRRKLLEDVAPRDILRGDRLLLGTPDGDQLTSPVITGALVVPLDEETRSTLISRGLEARRRTRIGIGVIVGSIGGIVVEGAIHASREEVFATGVLGIAAAVYGLRQNGIALDQIERANSPHTVEQVVTDTVNRLTTE